jgi:predicted Fe-Mo cluster-binding NifX family protein
MSVKPIKIAVPSSAPGGLNAEINTRFGRCECFTIVIIESNEIKAVEIIENPGVKAMGGAGPLAASTIAQEGVNIVIGGDYGPNAAGALAQGGIKTFGFNSNGGTTVKDVVDSFLKNQLNEISGANVPQHTGMGGRGGGMGGGGGGGMGGGQGRNR